MAAKKNTITTAIPDEILMSGFPCPTKVLLAVIIRKARTCENKVIMPNKELSAASGIGIRTITSALNQLKETKWIKETTGKNKERILSVDTKILAAVNSALSK